MTGGNIACPASFRKKSSTRSYEQLLEGARRWRFDVLLAWNLDRLSRSLRDLLNTLASLEIWGIDFISYSDRNLDTALTPPRRRVSWFTIDLRAGILKAYPRMTERPLARFIPSQGQAKPRLPRDVSRPRELSR